MKSAARAAGIIVAAGSGRRMGRPKQFLPLLGRPVVEWSLEAFLRTPRIEEVALVLAPENIREHGSRLASERVRVVEGGSTRMGSVRRGLAALGPSARVVAVHDGARPLVTPEIIRSTLDQAEASGAAVAAVPVKDTLKQAKTGDWVRATPPRKDFWLAQTPQCYRRGLLERALKRFPKDEDATDESQLVERAGHKVRLVPASYENLKITTPEDLVVAEALLSARGGSMAGRAVRSGFGYDIHRLVEGRELWLAGVRIPHAKGLLGHSDGDVALHAACDAVLGALGEGEIGIAFPPTDPRFKGLPSRQIVAHVLERLAARGARIVNLDLTVVAEEPKLKPHYPAFAASLAELFRLPPGRVNLKAKSNEGLGEIGSGLAIACYATASVAVPSA